jgi:DNA-binding SARP family transcriptional activator
MLGLSGLGSTAGLHADAIGAARRLLILEPYREAAHRRMMHALVTDDRAGDAVLYFRQCEAFLRRELGVGPGIKTRNLLRQIQASEILADASAEANRAAAESAAAEIATLRAALAVEMARNTEITRALEKLHDTLRELTSPTEQLAA